MPKTGNKLGPAPWPVPNREDDTRSEEETATKSQSGSIRILPDGTQVSDNIFRRIMSLGLDKELQYVSSYRRSRSDDQFDRHRYSNERSPTNSRVMNSDVTFVESDEEFECEYGQRPHTNSTNAEPQPLNLGKIAQDGDTNSSSSEDDDPASSPKYSVWLSPPHLPDYEDPFAEQEEKARNAENEPVVQYGIDIVEVESPCVHSSELQDYTKKNFDLSSEKPSSSKSSSQRSDTLLNLKSETELQRLDVYLKRQQEEEEAKREREEKEKAKRQERMPPRITRLNSDDLPKRLDISEIDQLVEELNFTPVSTTWKDSFYGSELKQDESQQSTRASNANSKPQGDKPDAKNTHGSPVDEETLSAGNRPSSIDRRHSRKGSLGLRSTSSKRPPGLTKLHRSSSVLGLTRPKTATKLIRSMSFRKARTRTPTKVASVRTAALQRELRSGFDGEESQRTLFYMKEKASTAIDLVANTCQRHLRVAVYLRRSGDKLRVEIIYPGGGKLRVSISFQQKHDAKKEITLVKVRPSRIDRGNKSLSRVFEFYTSLVTQLDIEGHIVSTNSS